MRRSEPRQPRRSKPTATSRSAQRGMKANAATWLAAISFRPRALRGHVLVRLSLSLSHHVGDFAVEADIAKQVKRAKDEATKAHTTAEQAIEHVIR
jgi:hypothetical protein